MSYHIGTSEGFPDGLKRILDGQIDNTIRYLTEVEDSHDGVHNARRCLKVIRAVYRLIREDLEASEYQCKNEFFRDLGRKLSELRDATAMIETIQLLQKHFSEKLDPQTLPVLKDYFLKERDELNHSVETEKTLTHDVADNLLRRKAEMIHFELSPDYRNNIIKGIYNVYRKGYFDFKNNYPKRNDEKSHDWRKRAKYLRYQLTILMEAWPAVFAVLESELHRLTDILGDFQNLCVLMEQISIEPSLLPENQNNQLLEMCSSLKAQLHQEAFPLGQRLFAEQPALFSKRMEQYLRSWEGF